VLYFFPGFTGKELFLVGSIEEISPRRKEIVSRRKMASFREQ
jgi:hypothetical protein